jgi:hypothetical protein
MVERHCSLLELALQALELPARTEHLKIHSKAMTLRARFTSTTSGLDAWKRTTATPAWPANRLGSRSPSRPGRDVTYPSEAPQCAPALEWPARSSLRRRPPARPRQTLDRTFDACAGAMPANYRPRPHDHAPRQSKSLPSSTKLIRATGSTRCGGTPRSMYRPAAGAGRDSRRGRVSRWRPPHTSGASA